MKQNYIIILAFLLYIFAMLFSWYTGLIDEDVMHFCANDFREAYDIALQSYNNTNARIGELLLYFVGVSSEGVGAFHVLWLYRIFNPIFIVACAFFVYRIGVGKFPTNKITDLLIFSFVILCLLCNKTSYYWLCSNMCWFYPTVVALFFFIMVEPFFIGQKLSPLHFVTAIFCAPIVGMSNETVSIVSVIIYIFAGVAYQRKNRLLLPCKQFIIIASVLLTFAILFYTAPGPHKRVESCYTDYSQLEFVVKNVFSLNWLHVLFWSWRLLLISLIVILICPLKVWKKSRSFIILFALIMLGGILMLAPRFGAPRALIPVEIVLIALMANIMHEKIREQSFNIWRVIILLICQIGLAITIIVPNVIRSIDFARYFFLLQEKADEVLIRGGTQLVIDEKDLELNSVWPLSENELPKTLIEIYPIYTKIKPTCNITAEYYEKANFEHRYAFCQYVTKIPIGETDLALNKGFAKCFGLQSIIVLKDRGLETYVKDLCKKEY